MQTRREFSKSVLGGGAALLASGNLAGSGAPLVFDNDADQLTRQDCDLLIKGGTVIDPGQHVHATLDVAVKDGKILEVSQDFSESRARKVVSAKGKIVTPGFIDLHVHCFDGIHGMNADRYCLTRGVTTVVDGGSAGYLLIDGFVKYVVHSSITRIHPLVNIGALGLLVGSSTEAVSPDSSQGFKNLMVDPDWVYPHLTAKSAELNRPAVVGIKVRLGNEIQGARDLECLKMGLQAAEACHLPVMAHIDGPYSPLPDILRMMRKGDVFTHFYNNHLHGILDANGKILPEVREARQRGVLFDPAQGAGHFSFAVAEKALEQDFLPDTIGTDLNFDRKDKQGFDLPTQVSKFMALGIDLDQAIGLVTIKPAQVFDYGTPLGTLRPGNVADIAISELQDGKFDFLDSGGEKRTGRNMLVNKAVARGGQLYINQT